MSEKRYVPLEFVICVKANPLTLLTRVTVTPGITAPELSVTVPVMADTLCARRCLDAGRRIVTKRRTAKNFFIVKRAPITICTSQARLRNQQNVEQSVLQVFSQTNCSQVSGLFLFSYFDAPRCKVFSSMKTL